MTLRPLTSALAGQTASEWGEKNPAVDTGTHDISYTVNHSIPAKCVFLWGSQVVTGDTQVINTHRIKEPMCVLVWALSHFATGC